MSRIRRETSVAARLQSFAGVAGGLVAVIGAAVLAGWALDVAALKSVLPGMPTMKPNTALAFIFAGLSLHLRSEREAAPFRRRLGDGCALLVCLISVLTLGEYHLERDFGIDQLLFVDRTAAGGHFPGRMATPTAVSFALLSSALLISSSRRWFWLFQSLTLATLILCLLIVASYLYGAASARTAGSLGDVALHTALLFLVLSIGMLAWRSDWGPMAIVTGGGTGGRTARNLIPAAICIPLLIGWLVREGERAGLYDTYMQSALFAVSNVFFFIGLTLWASASLHRTDIERKLSEGKFRRAVETAPNGMVMINPEGRIVLVNAQTERLFGYHRDELLGQPLEVLVPERFQKKHPDYRTGFFTDPQVRSMGAGRDALARGSLLARRKDGSEFPVEIGLNPIQTGEGLMVLSAIVDITERKRAEDALHASREMLRSVLDTVPQGIFWKDRESRFLGCNRVVAEAIGFADSTSIIGLRDSDIPSIAPEQAEFFVRKDREVMEADTPQLHLQERMTLADGSTIWLEMNRVPLHDKQGRVIGILGTWEDITERRRTEEALFQAFSMLDATRDGVFVFAPDTLLFTYVNRGAIAQTGYSRDELLTMSPMHLKPDFDETRCRETCANVLAQADQALVFETIHRRKDGSDIPVEIILQFVRCEESGQFIAVVRDISERKRAEDALRENEEKLRLFIEHAPAAIAMFDRDMRYLAASRRWHLDYGLPEADLHGRSHYDIFSEIPENWKQVHQRALGGEILTADADEFIRADGAVQWLRWEVRPWYAPGGAIGGIIIFAEEITERVRAMNEIRRLNADLETRVRSRTADLEAANKELEAFSYSISHDLRAPLRAIDGFSRIVMEDFGSALPAEAQEYLTSVRKSTQQMGCLIDELLNFSHLGRQQIRRVHVDLVILVRQCLEELRPVLEGRRVEFHVGDLPPCTGDPALLKQVWVNLLTNAIKYTARRDPAIVHIDWGPGPDGPTYIVRDNGVGFDMRYVHKLFGVFQRLHRAEEYEGTGVGLAIVQRIIHRHGGRVWAEAEPEKGAAFYFTLSPERDPTDEQRAPGNIAG